MLRLAAREADIVAVQQQFDPRGRPMRGEATEAALEHKIAIVRDAAGPRFEELELNLIVFDAAPGGAAARVTPSRCRRRPRPSSGPGSPTSSTERSGRCGSGLLRRRDRLGISYYTIPGHAMEAMAPLVAALAGR